MKVVFATTCKGRLEHLSATLPKNMKDNEAATFVVLDYNDQNGVSAYIQNEYRADLESGRLIFYKNKDAPKFRMGNAKNQVQRCAMREGADILVTLDADNLTGPGFVNYLMDKFGADPELSFMCPDFSVLPPRGKRFNVNNPSRLARGFAGRLAIRRNDFLKVGGYNESFETWRGEDIDIIARLNRLALKRAAIDAVFLNAISHSSAVRFLEYPDAKKYENDAILDITANAQDTVVNYGNVGCGVVYRNFDPIPITMGPIPTRIFGVGMQRTGTTSLHEAFKLLGFDSGHWKSAEWARDIWWEMNKWGHSRTLEKDYALTDNPIPVLYRQLDKAYPGSKFVLTVRDEDAWIDSVRKFWTHAGNKHRWTWDVDGFSHKMHAIIYGRVDFDEQTFRERYRRHNEEVSSYFAGPDAKGVLFALDIGMEGAMLDLCAFLDLPDRGMKFPHENKGDKVHVAHHHHHPHHRLT